jgi:hypothetical protein
MVGYIKAYHPDVAAHLTKQAQEGGRILVPGTFPVTQGGSFSGGHPGHQHHDHPHHHDHDPLH